MADQVLEFLGVDLPNIVVLPQTYDAYAKDNIIYIGDQMIAARDTMTLSQILLHEAGHIYEGHTGLINDVMDSLLSEGLLTAEQHSEILRNDELAADVYAAIGSWLLEPGVEVSSFSQYLDQRNEPPSDTHPSSEERIELVENIIDALTLAEASGTFENSGLSSLSQFHSDASVDSSVATDTPTQDDSNGHDDGSGNDGSDGGNSGDSDGDGGDGGDGGGDGGGG